MVTHSLHSWLHVDTNLTHVLRKAVCVYIFIIALRWMKYFCLLGDAVVGAHAVSAPLQPQQEVNGLLSLKVGRTIKTDQVPLHCRLFYTTSWADGLHHHHGRSPDAFAMLQRVPFRRNARGRRGGNGDFSGASEWRHRLASLDNVANAGAETELYRSVERRGFKGWQPVVWSLLTPASGPSEYAEIFR